MKTFIKLKNAITTIMLLLVVSLPFGQVSADSLPKGPSTEMGYVYRFWSDIFHGHFYTLSYDEATKVNNTDTNWKYEKVAFSGFSTQQAGTIPLYRFWSDNFLGHFYTADENEMTKVKNTDTNWKYEMAAFYVYPATYTGSAKTVYRFWSPVFKHHFYTADETEMAKVRDTDSNWTYEGPAFKVPNDDSSNNNTDLNQTLYQITDVVDGDTIKADIDGTVKTIRLIGIDTPETVDPDSDIQCYGPEASSKAKELLNGKSVRLENDSTQGDTDKYGRLLRYAYLADGTSYNQYMIANGFAHEYTYNTAYKYQTQYKQAEQTAKNSLLGFWSPTTCNGETTQPANQNNNDNSNNYNNDVATGIVKKSDSGNICHDSNSRWYDRTIYYTAYNTMEECLASGGQMYSN